MIYPINEAVDKLLASAVDEDTGELLMTDEELQKKFEELNLEFEEKVDSLACEAKNARYEAADIRAEKMKLAKRQSGAENRSERAKRFIAWLLKGDKFKSARNSIYYLNTKELIIEDREKLLEWCKENGRGFLNEPTLREADIKEALKNGANIPFCSIKENRSVCIR